jgi:hypothetical protein
VSDRYKVIHETDARERKLPGYEEPIDPSNPWRSEDNNWALFECDPAGTPVRLVFVDRMEPEDAILVRDLRPLVEELNALPAPSALAAAEEGGRGSATHELKTWPDPFNAILDGRKRYEIRKADRPFAEGDTLRLREWNEQRAPCGYTGRETTVRVTYMSPPGAWGLPGDLCVMGIAPLAAPVSEEEGSEGRAKCVACGFDRERYVTLARGVFLCDVCAEQAMVFFNRDRAPAPPPSTGDEAREIEHLRAQKDGAYRERDQVVALLARMALALGWRAGVRRHEPDPDPTWDEDWKNVVAIDLPSGQVTWHYHDSEVPLFIGLPDYQGSWDGHDTAEKYRRVQTAWPSPRAQTGTGTRLSDRLRAWAHEAREAGEDVQAADLDAMADEADHLESAALRREERDPRDAVVEAARGILLFCNGDGSPVDGFRFREEAQRARTALRALSSPATNPDDERSR